LAPELMQSKGERPADPFSFGIILTQRVRYAERLEKGQALCRLIAEGCHPPLQGVNDFKKFILQC
jgi:hypothetical protein